MQVRFGSLLTRKKLLEIEDTHTHDRAPKGTSVEIRGGSEECTSSSRPLAFACSRPLACCKLQLDSQRWALALDPFDCFSDCSSHRTRLMTHTFSPLSRRSKMILIDVLIEPSTLVFRRGWNGNEQALAHRKVKIDIHTLTLKLATPVSKSGHRF
ncbi:hypothetical protein CABS01_16127 [Colletotrichum abscissum]|uniref:uncharacterized protein n=1 Tax=Colletotrichum abscissum TaxID=1671311 RepID=UPI0027D5A1BC|nr:uncharacterized protein CABS01_16127 [Colletotrichum abscissum]KAK1472909.1 hypothetical protein CABS01_16127 [Colletotrichum abscissum]